MRRIPHYVLVVILLIASALPAWAMLQANGVTAEALGQANLRANTDVNAQLVGEIVSGTRYPVIGRSQFFPWVLLGDTQTAQPMGWVYADLVSVQGNINSVPFSSMIVGEPVALPTATPLPQVQASSAPTDVTIGQLNGVALPVTTAPTATPPPASGVTGTVLGEINIRFGPGTEYPRVGVAQAGDVFEITARHSQFPWLQLRYPGVEGGFGWVAADLLEVHGDVSSLPTITQSVFILPTLTPTLPAVQQSTLLLETPVAISPEFQALGDRLWNMVLSAGFEPETSRKGALFLMDMQTGEALTFGNDIAFSGMSITKIAILADVYRHLNAPPDSTLALDIGEAMICSQNTSTNDLLGFVGGGDLFTGAEDVTDLLQQLGLRGTFIVAPYLIDPNAPVTPVPIAPPVTNVDQQATEPDPWNQITVDEIGTLLGEMYQCAAGQDNALHSTFPDQFTQTECRQMLHAMSRNHIGELIEAGVPRNITVAHKHGWIEDAHGDAGVVYTPGGDYVLVMAFHAPFFLDYNTSFPLMAEISREVYNYFNSTAPYPAIQREQIPESCDIFGDPLIADLMSFNFDG